MTDLEYTQAFIRDMKRELDALRAAFERINCPVGWGNHLVMDGRTREPEDFTAPA